jgi:SAM-dependent methyltransferase
MEPELARALESLLSQQNAHYKYGLDLGCGRGEYGPILKKHVDWLVGVDKKVDRLSLAIRNGYDAVIRVDALEFPTNEYDVVFLFDVIEHLPKHVGYDLLNRIRGKAVYLTTPSTFFPLAWDGHVSIWTVEELSSLGFETYLVRITGPKKLAYGDKILAFRRT